MRPIIVDENTHSRSLAPSVRLHLVLLGSRGACGPPIGIKKHLSPIDSK